MATRAAAAAAEASAVGVAPAEQLGLELETRTRLRRFVVILRREVRRFVTLHIIRARDVDVIDGRRGVEVAALGRAWAHGRPRSEEHGGHDEGASEDHAAERTRENRCGARAAPRRSSVDQTVDVEPARAAAFDLHEQRVGVERALVGGERTLRIPEVDAVDRAQ